MTEQGNPEQGVAEAVGQLSDSTAEMVHREVERGRAEFAARLRANAPGVAALGGAALLGVFGLASGYGWSVNVHVPTP